MSLQQPESDLYQTLSSVHHEDDTKRNPASNIILTAHLDNQEVGGRETDQDCEIYENIWIKFQDNMSVYKTI